MIFDHINRIDLSGHCIIYINFIDVFMKTIRINKHFCKCGRVSLQANFQLQFYVKVF